MLAQADWQPELRFDSLYRSERRSSDAAVAATMVDVILNVATGSNIEPKAQA